MKILTRDLGCVWMCLCIAAASFSGYRLYHFRVGSSIVQLVTIEQSLQSKKNRTYYYSPNHNQFYDLLKLSTNIKILFRSSKKKGIIFNESNFITTENLWPCHFCEPFLWMFSVFSIHALIQYHCPTRKKNFSNKILCITIQTIRRFCSTYFLRIPLKGIHLFKQHSHLCNYGLSIYSDFLFVWWRVDNWVFLFFCCDFSFRAGSEKFDSFHFISVIWMENQVRIWSIFTYC